MNKTKKINKPKSRKTRRGEESVKKGIEFEDKVADLYRLLGADIVKNIEICQKKVDIIATFLLPGSGTPHRVIVECKNEKSAVAQNQRVMAFAGLLDIARRCGEAESAEIVTRVSWSDQAKGFARSKGITIQTYQEKVSQLIDFTPYLKNRIGEYENGLPERPSEPPLSSYYVEPSAKLLREEKSEILDLHRFVEEWINEKDSYHLAMLGEYGTGKTFFCQRVTYDFASSCISSPGSTRIPLLFNLRDFTKTVNIESLIVGFLDRVCGVPNPRFQLFKAMNDAGVFLLIFDGFDEMAVRVDADTLEVNMSEIERLVAHEKSRAIITTRTEYFISAEEQTRILQPRGQLLATRGVEYMPVRIKPWDNEKIEEFLRKRVPQVPSAKKDWKYYRDQLENIPGLSDLARRPVLLDMIAKTLPQLIASGKPINRPNLYYIYLIGELKRQKVAKRRTLLLPEETRLNIMQNLAAKFYEQDEPAITFSEALEQIATSIQPPRSELEAHTRDFLNCSFLIREGDEFRFSHRSIMEYLVGRALNVEIEQNEPSILIRQRLDVVVAGFIAEMNPDLSTLWKWIDSTRSDDEQTSKYVGGNAVTLLCMQDKDALLGKDLSHTNLLGARLSAADLTKTNLKNTNFNKADFSYTSFEEESLRTANVTGARFGLTSVVNIRQKDMEGSTDFSRFMKYLESSLTKEKSRVFRGSWAFIHTKSDLILAHVAIQCSSIDTLEKIRTHILSNPDIVSIVIYASEYRALESELGEGEMNVLNHVRSKVISLPF
jgi:hypothetical protein